MLGTKEGATGSVLFVNSVNLYEKTSSTSLAGFSSSYDEESWWTLSLLTVCKEPPEMVAQELLIVYTQYTIHSLLTSGSESWSFNWAGTATRPICEVWLCSAETMDKFGSLDDPIRLCWHWKSKCRPFSIMPKTSRSNPHYPIIRQGRGDKHT